jgi:hypothetical protein
MKKTSLLILALSSVACSRAVFLFLDDPEGPNLLTVFVLAAVLLAPSFALYSLQSPSAESRRVVLAICLQLALAGCLAFFFGGVY